MAEVNLKISSHIVLKKWIVVIFYTVTQAVGKREKQIVGVNDTAILRCSVNESEFSSWQYQPNGPDGVVLLPLSQGATSYHHQLNVTHNEKTNTTNYDLILSFVSEENGGTYICLERIETVNEIFLAIEVPPVVRLLRGNSPLGDITDVIQNNNTIIRCVAERSRPLVNLSWTVNDRLVTFAVSVDRSREEDRVVSSDLHYVPKQRDKNISCITSGQTLASVNVTTNINVQYAPVCHTDIIYTIEPLFVCSCDSNPPVHELNILINETAIQRSNVKIPSEVPSKLSCVAVNQIGKTETEITSYQPNSTGHSSPMFPVASTGDPSDDIPVSIVTIAVAGCSIVVISVAAVVAIVARRRHSAAMQVKDGPHLTSGPLDLTSGMVNTISARPPVPSPQPGRSNIFHSYAYAKEPIHLLQIGSETSCFTTDEEAEHNVMYSTIPSMYGQSQNDNTIVETNKGADRRPIENGKSENTPVVLESTYDAREDSCRPKNSSINVSKGSFKTCNDGNTRGVTEDERYDTKSQCKPPGKSKESTIYSQPFDEPSAETQYTDSLARPGQMPLRDESMYFDDDSSFDEESLNDPLDDGRDDPVSHKTGFDDSRIRELNLRGRDGPQQEADQTSDPFIMETFESFPGEQHTEQSDGMNPPALRPYMEENVSFYHMPLRNETLDGCGLGAARRFLGEPNQPAHSQDSTLKYHQYHQLDEGETCPARRSTARNDIGRPQRT